MIKDSINVRDLYCCFLDCKERVKRPGIDNYCRLHWLIIELEKEKKKKKSC